MDSLKEFLSPYVLINDESEYHPGSLTILLQNDQPARVFDQTGQTQPFETVRIADLDSLAEKDIYELLDKAVANVHIVVLDDTNQVCGVIRPARAEELQIAARAVIHKGELGITIMSPPPIDPSAKDGHLLREWWYQVLRNRERYECFAFFLCLPSDGEAIKYLTNFGKELDILSGNNCLVIALSDKEFKWSRYDETVWNFAVNEQVSEGYSTKIADHFKIGYTEFPCIVLFEDVRSPKQVPYSFKGLEAQKIAEQMREIFWIIKEAVSNGKRPLSALEHDQKMKHLKKVRQSAFNRLFSFAEKSFETAMETLIKASLK